MSSRVDFRKENLAGYHYIGAMRFFKKEADEEILNYQFNHLNSA